MKKRYNFLLLLSLIISPAFSQDTPTDKVEIEQKIQNFMAAEDIPAITFAIIKQGKVAFSGGFGVRVRETEQAVSQDTLFQIGSQTKTLTGIITAELIKAGKLKLSDTVIELLPNAFPTEFVTQFESLTIEHLLLHRSGLPNYLSNVTRIDGDAFLGGFSEEMFLAGLKSIKPEFAANEKWQYANLNYALLGYVLSKLTDKTYPQLINQYITKQYGLASTLASLSDNTIKNRLATPYRKDNRKVITQPWDMGLLTAHGGAYSNVFDLARLMELQIAAYTRYQKTGHASPLVLTQVKSATGVRPGMSYGFGMTEVTTEAGMFSKTVLFHGGDLDGYGCEYLFSTEMGVGVVMLTSSGGRKFHKLAMNIMNELLQ
jgi:CubicO group peptidase (beta-lactamase class C family)